MRLYIPAIARAALMEIKRGTPADADRLERIEARHKEIACQLYSGIMTGTIFEAHQRAPRHLTIYHRSTRGNFIQESHFYQLSDGSWDAMSHRDIIRPDDLELTPGWITISA